MDRIARVETKPIRSHLWKKGAQSPTQVVLTAQKFLGDTHLQSNLLFNLPSKKLLKELK